MITIALIIGFHLFSLVCHMYLGDMINLIFKDNFYNIVNQLY